MNKVKRYYATHKKLVLGMTVGVIAVVLIAAMLYMNREQVKLDQDTFVINVNSEFDKKAESYLKGMKNPEQATADWDKVDMSKIGLYDVTIKYKGEEYKIRFDVRDKEKPVLKLSKTEFEFTLDTSLEDVNKVINEAVTVTDNYDKKFEAIKVVSELPKEIGEQTYHISVKDTTGNESDKVQIKVTYTEPVVEEEEPQDSPQYQEGGQVETTQGGYTPEAPVVPAPNPATEPQAPVDIPADQPTNNGGVQKVEVNIPEGALDGGLLPSSSACFQWAEEWLRNNPDSGYSFNGIKGTSIETGEWRCYIEHGY